MSSLIIQTTGTPIGGSLSAQIASLVLIYRELKAKGIAKRELDQILRCRYRDNFSVNTAVTLRPNEPVSAAVARRASTILKHPKSVFNMRVTLEQWGHEIDYLESRLGDVQGPNPLRVKSTQWTCSPGAPTPPRPQKLIDPIAPNARDMVRTFVPNEVKKSAWYRLSPAVATENVSQLVTLLNAKSYPPTWWTQPLRRSATRWGLKLPSGSLGGPFGEPSSLGGSLRTLTSSLKGTIFGDVNAQFLHPKKAYPFFGQLQLCPRREDQQPSLLLLLDLHIYTPASGLGILAIEIFGHCSAQTF